MEFMHLSIKTVSLFVKDLLIEWSTGKKICISLHSLRLACPCAGCAGEHDALGKKYTSPSSLLVKKSFDVVSYETVGLYGLRFFWADGHSDGLYTFKLLSSLSEK